MAILRKTPKLRLTQYVSNSYDSTLINRYNEDMRIVDEYVSSLEVNLDARFLAISEDITDFKTLVNENISSFTEEISSELEQFKSDVNTDIDIFKAEVTDSVDSCIQTVLTFDDRIIHLETCCDEATNKLNEHQEWLENIQSVIDTVSTANIKNLEDRLTALEHKVEANSRLIATNLEYIQDIRRSIESMQEHLTNIDNKIVTIESDITYLKQCCELVQSTLTEIQNSLADIFQTLDVLRVDVDKNRRDIEANATDIITVANQAQTNARNIEEILRELNGIPNIEQLVSIIGDIDRIKQLLGTDVLKTEAQTVTGAINELFDRPTASGNVRVVYDEETQNIKFVDENGLVVYYISGDENIVFPSGN